MTEVPAELALLRELRQRRMGREGIPMVLVLTDERDGRTASLGSPTDDGGRLGDRLAELAETLAPRQRDDDIALVETLVQVVSYEDFSDVVTPT